MLAYFVPGWQGATLERLATIGLGHAFDRPPVVGIAPRGPDGGQGVILTAEEVRRAEWEWTRAPGRSWWVGTWGETQPEGLARARQIAGHRVRLEDGHEWLVPVARSFAVGSVLPQRLVLGEDGKTWEGRPLARFVAISARAARVARVLFDELEEGEGPLVVLGEGADIAVEALAINYRIGPVEAAALGLLSEPAVFEVCKALVDWPTIERVLREREEAATGRVPFDGADAGPSTADGVEDS